MWGLQTRIHYAKAKAKAILKRYEFRVILITIFDRPSTQIFYAVLENCYSKHVWAIQFAWRSSPTFFDTTKILHFGIIPRKNWMSGYRVMNNYIRTENNIKQNNLISFFGNISKQYLQHPTHSPWSCHLWSELILLKLGPTTEVKYYQNLFVHILWNMMLHFAAIYMIYHC